MKNDFTQYNNPIDIQGLKIPPITDWKKFELLCRDLWKNEPNKFEHVDINGRKGQKQYGVDIYGRYIESGSWLGLSCKVRKDVLEESVIRSDVKKAQNFTTKLSEYCFVTTVSADTQIQKVIREINDSNVYDFSIDIIFWEAIIEKLQESRNHDILFRYYHDLFIDNTRFGYSIGKLLSLHLGVEGVFDTTYELMIGHVPPYKEKKPIAQDYYRNTYYISNLNDKTIEFFTCDEKQTGMKPKCLPSDIEMAFHNKYDCWRVSDWLFSFDDISKIMHSEDDHFHFSITNDRFEFIHQSLEEE